MFFFLSGDGETADGEQDNGGKKKGGAEAEESFHRRMGGSKVLRE
jgi:hypothetical protein